MAFDPLYLFNNRDSSALSRRKRKRTLTIEKDATFLLSEHCIKFIEWARIESVESKEWADQELNLLLSNCSKHFGKAFSLSLNDLPHLASASKPLLDSNLFKNIILELRIRLLTHLASFPQDFVDDDVLRWAKEFSVIDESVDMGKLASHLPKLKEQLEIEKRKLEHDFRFLFVLYRVGIGSKEKADAILRLSPLPSPEVRERLAIIFRTWKRGLRTAETYEQANLFKNSFSPRLRHFFTLLRYLQSDYEHLPSTIFPGGFNDEARIASADRQEEGELEDHDLEEKMSQVPPTAGALGSGEPQNGGSQKSTSAQAGLISANTSLILPGNFTNVQPGQTSDITPVPPLDVTTQAPDLTTSVVLFESQSSPVDFPLPITDGIKFNPDLNVSGLSLFGKQLDNVAEISDPLLDRGWVSHGPQSLIQSQLSVASIAQHGDPRSHSKVFGTIPNAQPWSVTVDAQVTRKAGNNESKIQEKQKSQASQSLENEEDSSQSFNIPLAQEVPYPQLPPSLSDREGTLSQELWPTTGTTLAEDSAVQTGLNNKRGGGDGQTARNSQPNENDCKTPWIRPKVDQNAQLKSNADSQSQVKSTLEILNTLCESGLEGDTQLISNTQSQLTKQQYSKRDATESRSCVALEKQSRGRRVSFPKR